MSQQLIVSVLLMVLPLCSEGFSKTQTKKTRSTRAAASEHMKTPVRADAPLGSREATLEKLSQDYLHSPDAQTQKALVNFCEEGKEPSLPGLAYFLIGFSELQHQRLESAQEFLRKAAAHSTPINDYSQYYLAEALFRLGRFEEASEALRDYFSKFSESPMKEKALSIYWESSLILNKPQAILESVQSLASQSERPESLYYLAQAQESLGQKEDALKTYQKVYYVFPLYDKNSTILQQSSHLLEQNPGLRFEIPKEWRISRIEKLVLRKQWQEALGDLDLLGQADPGSVNSAQFGLWRGISEYGAGKYLNAIETLKKVNSSDIDKSAQARFYIAESYRKLEDYPHFKQSVENLVEAFSKSVWCENALFSIGNYNLVKRNLDESTHFYQKIVDLFPSGNHVEDSHWRVTWRYYRLKNYERALQMFVDHLVRYPDSDNRLAASYWAARCKEALGQSGEALQIYQALQRGFSQSYYGQLSQDRMTSLGSKIEKTPTKTPELAQILQTLTKNGKTAKVADLSQLQESSWGVWPRVHALGLIQLFDQAAQELLRPQIYGQSPVVYFQAAQLYYRAKNFLPAISNLRRVFPNYLETPLEFLPRSIWEVFFPVNFASVLFKEAERQKVDPYLLLALIRQESVFDPRALSGANAHGLMQLLPSTARLMARSMGMNSPSVSRLTDPEINIPLGTKYFSDLLRRFDGQSDKALASYNAGENRVEAWATEGGFADNAEFVETIPFSQTRNYVKTIDRNYWFYKRLYGDR